ncbi:MAG: PIN domain-containing protein [Chloroflexi bacterium]|nr:PIN domain-containing protein [Chloroflexota bacterium]
MRTLFADTAYWLALILTDDPWHDVAVLLSHEYDNAIIVTTEMVITELLNAVSRFGEYHRTQTVNEVLRMRSDPNVEIIGQTELQFRNAFNLYRSRPDQRWGLTDCSSFVLMRERGITHALTADRDFTQAGFTILM